MESKGRLTTDIHMTARARRAGNAMDARDGAAPDFNISKEYRPLNNPDPSRPSSYPRRVLLAVTGLSPQIVTETLYALAVKPANVKDKFIPTEIHLITTSEGTERARLALLSDDPGWFHHFCRDYRLPGIHFESDSIHELPGVNTRSLTDIRSVQDNERAADFITDQLREFSQDHGAALHVSIAGGRKTMGYYAGYALSLFGRGQDRLSHVLVNEPFESSWDFFYPTPYSRVITTRENKLADTRDAEVMLAEIPFVRLRDELPDELLNGHARFTASVREAQKAIPPLSLTLNPTTRSIPAGGETFQLKPVSFAFYWMLTERARKGLPGLHWSDSGLADELLGYLGKVTNAHSGIYEKTETIYRKGYTKENFDPAKSHVNNAIKKVLGNRRAQPYLITLQGTVPGTRYRRSGLNLPSKVIIIETQAKK